MARSTSAPSPGVLGMLGERIQAWCRMKPPPHLGSPQTSTSPHGGTFGAPSSSPTAPESPLPTAHPTPEPPVPGTAGEGGGGGGSPGGGTVPGPPRPPRGRGIVRPQLARAAVMATAGLARRPRACGHAGSSSLSSVLSLTSPRAAAPAQSPRHRDPPPAPPGSSHPWHRGLAGLGSGWGAPTQCQGKTPAGGHRPRAVGTLPVAEAGGRG